MRPGPTDAITIGWSFRVLPKQRQMILTYFDEVWEKSAEAGPIMSRYEGVLGSVKRTRNTCFSFPPNKCNERQSVDAN